jgi:hypothetical protein
MDKVLIAVAGTDGNAFAALGTAAGKYGCSGLGLHSGQKAVGLRPMAAVRLKCALGHDAALLISLENLCLKASSKYNGFRPKGQAQGGYSSLECWLSLRMVQLRRKEIFARK